MALVMGCYTSLHLPGPGFILHRNKSREEIEVKFINKDLENKHEI